MPEFKEQEASGNGQVYKTRSIQLAAFLAARGHKVVSTSKEGPATFFHFNDTPELPSDIKALKFGDDSVSARNLFEARTRLLGLIHDDDGPTRR